MSLLFAGTADALERRMTPAPERAPIEDPVKWCRDVLDEHPWSVQREIMRAVLTERRVAVPACHGPGKSYLASRVAGWWIDRHPIGDAFVVSSAPTTDQVRGILWRELGKAHRRGSLPGTITGLTGGTPTWHVGPELIGWGRKPADLADPDQARQAFSGIHAPYVLVILDEATGVPEWLWQAALSLLTNANARILAIGNPDDPSSKFAEVCAPGSGWWVKHISAFDCPNLTGEAVPEVVREGTVSREWVEEAERDYGGVDNPLYVSKVLGQFPDRADSLVVQPRHVKAAWLRDLPGRLRGAYGLDVARSPTGDWSALYRNRGGVLRLVDTWRGLPITAGDDEDSTVARAHRLTSATPAVPIVVDADGLGAGAYDGLRAIKRRAVAFSSAGPARRPDRFDSRRSELWWEAREALERGEWDLDPEDEQLAAQLQTPRWWVDARGRIHVETKKELAKRGKKSPDRADAAIMATFGAPVDLKGAGPMGESAPKPKPKPSTGGVPSALRVRKGEASSLKSRPM